MRAQVQRDLLVGGNLVLLELLRETRQAIVARRN